MGQEGLVSWGQSQEPWLCAEREEQLSWWWGWEGPCGLSTVPVPHRACPQGTTQQRHQYEHWPARTHCFSMLGMPSCPSAARTPQPAQSCWAWTRYKSYPGFHPPVTQKIPILGPWPCPGSSAWLPIHEPQLHSQGPALGTGLLGPTCWWPTHPHLPLSPGPLFWLCHLA